MPRGSTQTYNIMLQGIDKRDIFIKKSDYLRFVHYILKAREKSILTFMDIIQ